MTAEVLAIVIATLPLVETPHGVPPHPGPAGETGRWALTPRVRIDRGRELRARGEPVTDEAIAREHVLWLEKELPRAGVDPVMFNILLAWNCGLTQTAQGRAPERSFDFARRVIALMEQAHPHLDFTMNTTTSISPGALTPFALVARTAELEPWAMERLEPARFRSEENFREVNGVPHLTVAGIRAMGRVLEMHGYATRAHSLRVLANRVENTPSVTLPQRPVAKSTEQQPAWMGRADLA
jgi:hypothetical protein